MGRGDEGLVIRHGAEVVFHLVEIDSAIAVIVGSRVVLVVNRSEPERGYAKIFQIGKVFDNAFKIAAVIGLRRVTVIGSRRRARRHVVGRVTVGEAVGHDEVDDVVARDALKSALLRLARRQDQVCAGVTR